ncbi:hypothetical protein [Desulfovibrio oxyclinae]|uniref:hypothetical protein n=1 Tax=Desulfovibrio oxyclinae TaxID=63560 RepID=UPI00037A072A|nr:hypothetical protein [Desulfovibrio oxyclinae]
MQRMNNRQGNGNGRGCGRGDGSCGGRGKGRGRRDGSFGGQGSGQGRGDGSGKDRKRENTAARESRNVRLRRRDGSCMNDNNQRNNANRRRQW